ncbi:MoaD/ThiS family protein [Brachybacterium sp. YJGR34]|uniref:MoaD/ThiS family protein n=1 Tax=Brachybacterium sp. YJGR34 TaxID=2059911 RepID=UPI000E0C7EA6|nr:MoaD/ThiS family protein [Brachybacterium sp. YJGR34]
MDTTDAAPAIAVRLFAGAAAEYGADAATVHGATVGEALADLRRDAPPDARRVIDRSSLLLNAVVCTDHDQELVDGDRLDVLPPFAGG